ncbi:MAG: sugar ABC transporter permease, partial [Hyphomicrobiales bacterium]|nr:sugar ABC transporter permease [Hyphomicrobiales bacterium]
MNAPASPATLIDRAARATPPGLAGKVRGLSDKTIAWLFISPTIVLLLAINIFPLIWTIQLSFTSYRANRPNAPLRDVGLAHYNDILTNPDIWAAMQVTARFVIA